MAEKTTYDQAMQSNPASIDWLEEWPSGTEFPDKASKEAYAILAWAYINNWLELYNKHPSVTQPFNIKAYGEKPTGEKVFRPFVLLTPTVSRHLVPKKVGDFLVHLIPPEPPPPPKDDEI